jgi:hypothetical protein
MITAALIAASNGSWTVATRLWCFAFCLGVLTLSLGAQVELPRTAGTTGPLPVLRMANGYIDVAGQVVITPKFERAGHFHEALAAVCCTDGKTGYIDASGSFRIPPTFARGIDNAGPFSEGVALAQKPNSVAVYIDRTGREIGPLLDHP